MFQPLMIKDREYWDDVRMCKCMDARMSKYADMQMKKINTNRNS
jgi:hypothetical protein